MEVEPQRPKRQEDATSALNAAIMATSIAGEVSCIAPAKTLFGSVNILLEQIRVCFLLSCDDLLQIYI